MPFPADTIDSLSADYTILARGKLSGSPALAVANYQKGRIVLIPDNVQGDQVSMQTEPRDVIARSILWACHCSDDEVALVRIPASPVPPQTVAATAPAAPPRYEGLLAEMRAADSVVLLDNQTVDWNMNSRHYQVSGAVKQVYKGTAKIGDTLHLDVDDTAMGPHREQGNREAASPRFVYPIKGEPLVYLLKGTQLLNIGYPERIIPDYARISLLPSNAQAGVELIRLYAQMNLVEGLQGSLENPYFFIADIKRCFAAINPRGPEITAMAATFRDRIFDQIVEHKQIDMPAIFIASFLPESDRRKMVAALLPQYTQQLAAAEEYRRNLPARAPSPVISPGRELSAPPRGPNPGFIGSSIWILTDLTWQGEISDVSRTSDWYQLIPNVIFQVDPLHNPDNLEQATAFATRP